MRTLRSISVISALAVLLSAGAARAADESPFKFEFHGFVTGSMFMQNQVFLGGTGQDNLLAAPTPANEVGGPGFAGSKSDSFLGADARQSRWIFIMTGPQAFGATPRSYFEGDFLGASATAGPGGIENTQARLRAAFGELKWGTTQLQVGQFSAQLILAQLSASVAHIANPITFGTGTIGGRSVGVRVIHSMPMGDMKLELGAEAFASKFADPVRGGTPATVSAGWDSGMPMLGARAKLDGKSGALGYSLYVAGLYESVDLKGYGDTAPNGITLPNGTTKKSLSPYAAEVGGNFLFAPISVAFNVYMGKGAGVWAGAINQGGEISDLGYWAQLGLHPTKQIGLFGLFGQNKSDEDDVRLWGGSRKDNQLIGGIARFSDGGYTLAAEYYQFKTTYLTGGFGGTGTAKTDGYQAIVSGHYAF